MRVVNSLRKGKRWARSITHLMVQFSISSCFSRSTRTMSSLFRRCSSVSCWAARSSTSRRLSSSICSLFERNEKPIVKTMANHKTSRFVRSQPPSLISVLFRCALPRWRTFQCQKCQNVRATNSSWKVVFTAGKDSPLPATSSPERNSLEKLVSACRAREKAAIRNAPVTNEITRTRRPAGGVVSQDEHSEGFERSPVKLPGRESGVLLLAAAVPVIAAVLRVRQGADLLLQDLDLNGHTLYLHSNIYTSSLS